MERPGGAFNKLDSFGFGLILGAVGKKKKLRRVTQTYPFRCRIAVGIDPSAPFLSILPRKPLKCGKTAKMAVLRDLASWQLRGLK